jgi:type IV pilus assembly protein PilA
MELMVTVAIIGILAAIAIPNFASYQARARRSEAYTHLSGLARAQKSYQAEHGSYLDTGTALHVTLPDYTAYGGLGTTKMPWDATAAAFFGQIGWGPEGQVHYTYESNAGLGPCTCTLCFTVAAHGDVDGDGSIGSVVFVHPERDGNGAIIGSCKTHVGGGLGAPVLANGTTLYDEPAANLTNDDY